MTAMRDLVCPYCGSGLTISMETVGRPYLQYEQPESIECDSFRCSASWGPTGKLRSLPLAAVVGAEVPDGA